MVSFSLRQRIFLPPPIGPSPVSFHLSQFVSPRGPKLRSTITWWKTTFGRPLLEKRTGYFSVMPRPASAALSSIPLSRVAAAAVSILTPTSATCSLGFLQ